jgi:hypothetical protein
MSAKRHTQGLTHRWIPERDSMHRDQAVDLFEQLIDSYQEWYACADEDQLQELTGQLIDHLTDAFAPWVTCCW